MLLSPHFTLAEMTVSETAARRGIDNTPSEQIISNLQRLSAGLEDIRRLVGRPILVSSGYRSQALNKAVGGSTSSVHTQGLAADIIAVGLSPRELARQVVDSGLMFDQLILEFDQWVHFGLSAETPRRQVLTIRRGSGYLSGLI
ncbi:D-Ala-D-Ala carboxypeptidase family metallohydrolase [Pseudomonas rubra]|uniref:D-Ala-D-Ala carboxypeptidase family metallohydrolase n=1 Tax=Pseudomonas rubra TaxID=2942627 RepID=A0ABT5PCE0_9PSED|nr:D-Ala-D-Ala carboxypeptidase family metallohydrolase [Pseudomonas rubra]MDD1015976.1 D-Ala-D-Ala carboxypeptidase family metallohydrolase [Pseudomonas rubra]MDD1039253.1 D-Ala-D-Ala carboxypeptidase family metallohydrolase [Pseudomonas rubra]MDD1155223.1 D-Ala-D-Ala carboxypeptidase family metallohydrolase [Pseudomonas rubra]